MKILLDYEVSADEFDDLTQDFETVSYNETPSEIWSIFTEVEVDSKELLTKEFDDWLQNYIDTWYSVVWDWFKQKYILTNIA